jgi:WD40 repeat protein
VYLWDSKSGKQIGEPFFHGAGMFSVAFKPNSTVVIAAGKDHAIRAWDYKTRQEQLALRGHLGWVKSVTVTLDGKTVTSASYDNTIKVWNWAPPSDALDHGVSVQALAISNDDRWLASGDLIGAVKIWDLATNELVGEIKDHTGPITALAFVPNIKEHKLAVGTWFPTGTGSVKLWDVTIALGKLVAKEGPAFQGHTKGVYCLAFAKNKTLATGSADGTAILWDVATGQRKHTLKAEREVCSLAFSPSGATLATGDPLGRVRFWETATGALARRKPPVVSVHEGAVHALVFGSEDFQVLSAGADHTVKLWSWKPDQTPAAEMISRVHNQPVSCLTSLGGAAFASGSWDRTVKLWDLRDQSAGEERFTLPGHGGAVRALAATANRQLLASAGNDGVIRLWRASAPFVMTK